MFNYKKNILKFLALFHLFFNTILVIGAEVEGKKSWKFDLRSENILKNRTSEIELIHAEEGKYLGAQKSKEGILIFQGGIIIRLKGYTLYADTVKINPETNEIYGEGEVTLADGIQIVKGSKFIYDNRISAGVLYSVEGYYQPLYFMGDQTKITGKNNLVTSSAFFSTCSAESQHYFLKAQKIWLQENQKFVAFGVVYHVGQVPVFYLPFLMQTDIGTGIQTLFGQSGSRGIFMQNTYFFGFPSSNILPTNAKFMLDFYQLDGTYLGLFMQKRSPKLNYDIDLGLAFNTLKTADTGSLNFSNSINLSGYEYFADKISYTRITRPLYEINVNLNTSWNASFEKDSQSAVNVVFEQYNDVTFQNLFKNRREPKSTLESISIDESFPSIVPNYDLLWRLIYSENWQGNSLNVTLQRNQYYNAKAPLSLVDQTFYPYDKINDIFPEVRFSKSFYVVKPISPVFQGITNQIQLLAGMQSQYLGNIFNRFFYYGDLRSGFQAHFPLLSFLAFRPSIGCGLKGQFYNIQSDPEKLENGRKTFQYLFSTDTLTIGPSFLKLSVIYNWEIALNPRYPDPYFFTEVDKNLNYAETQNKLGFTLSSDFAPFGSVSLGTSRDLRPLPGTPDEVYYWDPLNVSAFFDYDFINQDNIYLPEKKLRESFYMGIGASEILYYNMKFNTFGSNNIAFYFQTGGYQFLFLDKVKLLKTGIVWNHDFLNPHRNNFLFFFESRFTFLKFWEFDIYLSTSAPNLGDSTDSYKLLTEFLNDPFSTPTKSPFYLNSISLSLLHDLHDWTMSITYTLNQSWIPFSSNRDFAGYYEHIINIGFNLKGLPASEYSQIPVIPFSPRESPEKYGIY